MKTCTKCGIEKEPTEFHKNKTGLNGLRGDCKSCKNEYRKEYHFRNKERESDANKKYRVENSEKIKEYRIKTRVHKAGYNKKWAKDNKPLINFFQREWAEKNPEKVRERAMRRSLATKGQCPAWANLDKIREFYAVAKQLTETHGTKFEVDHIIPLRGKYVTGLHVETNLQIITQMANGRKGNRFDVLGRF